MSLLGIGRASSRKQRFAGIGMCASLVLTLIPAPLAVTAVTASPAAAATIPSSQGTDFWVVFENNDSGEALSQNLFVFISGSTATSGTISIPGIAFTQTFSVTPGVATQVAIPLNAEDDNADGVDPLGIHVTANDPVSVYGLNTKQFTTDGFLGLPTAILGTAYLTEGYVNDGVVAGSQFAIVGVANGTTATITPSETVGPHTAGVPYTVALNQGDVYQLTDDASSTGDLSGTTITADKAVAVFGGHACANVPDGGTVACNTLAEEMTPTNTWGTDFLTEPFATRTADTFRIMASTASTAVSVNGTVVATIGAGQFFQTSLSAASVITATKPVQVMQYSNGQSFDNSTVADPFDVTVPPTEQFLNSYTVSAEPSGADPAISQNYLNVVAPSSEVGAVTLDGSLVPAADFAAIPGSTYSGAQIPVDFGSHTISASLPFGLTVYGYGETDGYGYPGGFTLSPIATVSRLTLAPTSSSHSVNTSACETATVTDQNSLPVAGVRVDFSVTGVNPTSGFAFSASDGTAQFCYTGTAVGADTEGAAVGSVTSNSAAITWTSTVNHLPVANDQSVSTNQDTAKAVTLTATDADNDPLTYSVVTNPAHGTLSGTAPNLTYTPNAGYNGPDSFTFKANDGKGDSNTATVSITVVPVVTNHLPVANDQSVTTDQDTAKAVTLTATDADNDPLTYSVVTNPAHGTLSGTAPNLTYTPNAGYNGPDSFTFKANDGKGDSNTATISITVNPATVNQPPEADWQCVSTTKNTPVSITLTGSDPENDPLTYAIVDSPSHGTLSGDAPNVVYTPDQHFKGLDLFTFKVNDGHQDSNVATVAITVQREDRSEHCRTHHGHHGHGHDHDRCKWTRVSREHHHRLFVHNSATSGWVTLTVTVNGRSLRFGRLAHGHGKSFNLAHFMHANDQNVVRIDVVSSTSTSDASLSM